MLADRTLSIVSVSHPACPSYGGHWHQGLYMAGKRRKQELLWGSSCVIKLFTFHWFGGPSCSWLEALTRDYKTKCQVALPTPTKSAFEGMVFLILLSLGISFYRNSNSHRRNYNSGIQILLSRISVCGIIHTVQYLQWYVIFNIIMEENKKTWSMKIIIGCKQSW